MTCSEMGFHMFFSRSTLESAKIPISALDSSYNYNYVELRTSAVQLQSQDYLTA